MERLREGVTQGDPLEMVAYRIGILPLIKCLKSTYPDRTQTWYADDSGALGTFDHLDRHFKVLKCNDPARGYYLKPIKIILAVHPQNLESGELFCQRHGFKVCTGAR